MRRRTGLWVLDLHKLNAAAGFEALPLTRHPALQFLARQAESRRRPDALAKHLGLPTGHCESNCFHTQSRFQRIIGQSGAFTIHPKPQAGHEIQNLVTNERHLVRHLIPAAAKRPLLEALGPSAARNVDSALSG